MLLPVPHNIVSICQALQTHGGKAWLVGGCVRDLLLGKQPKDWDIEVFGLDEAALEQALQGLGRFALVGKQFGVRKLWLDDWEIDIALPRKEIKTGQGHKGFDVLCDPHLSPEKASLRRDFTINAMAYDPLSHTLLDFHGGQQDLRDKVLRHVSPAFVEDPLRPLRAMQFAARFALLLHEDTAALCRKLLDEADTLPAARVWQEWQKWAMAAHPSYGLKVLQSMGWDKLYPELVALQGCPQDAYWHPEGDVWVHTCLVVDAAQKLCEAYALPDKARLVLMFAALCHDLGKPKTTKVSEEGRITSPNHGQAGVQPGLDFLARIAAPKWLKDHIKPLVAEHVAHFSADKPTPRAVRRLAKRLSPSCIRQWEMLTEADANGRHPAPPSRPALAWLKLAESLGVADEQSPPIVTGKHLQAWGMPASPGMGKALEQAYAAQMDGVFDDEASAFEWCKNNIL